MTITATDNPQIGQGNGVTTAFSTPFYQDEDELLVYFRSGSDGSSTLLMEGTHYTLSGEAAEGGGTVTITDPAYIPATGDRIVVTTNVGLDQALSLDSTGPFPAKSVENAGFDRTRLVDQQQQSQINRSLRAPADDINVDMELPLDADRANTVLGFGADGEPVAHSYEDLGALLDPYVSGDGGGAGELPDMPQATVLGRASGAGTGTPTNLTGSELRTIANVENGATADQTAGEIETAYNSQVAAASQAEMEAGTETAIRRVSPLRVAQSIAALSIPNTRTVSAGSGLSGGGALSSNVTLSVNFGGSGNSNLAAYSNHDHDNATTSDPGFMSAADKTLLDSLVPGVVLSQDETISPDDGGDPPESIPLLLNPATDASGNEVDSYYFTETLTGDFEFSFETAGQRNGHTVRVHRLGSNATYGFTGVNLTGGTTDASLAQYQTLTAQFDGSAWVCLSITGQTPGGITSFDQVVEVITASTNLTDARQMYGVSGSAARHLTLLIKPSTGSDNIVLTLPDAAALGFWYVVRDASHTGSLTIVNQTSAGSLNGTTGATITVSTQARSAALVHVYEQPGSGAVAKVAGETTEDVVMPGLLTVGSVLGTPVTSVSGSMTVAAHSGRVCVISGNVTVPVTNGFSVVIISTGSYTVGAGGATTALTSGDSIAVMVAGSTVYRSPVTALTTMPQS